MYVYSVSENGQELFRGTAPEIYRKYSILISNLSWHIRKGTLVDGRYRIAKVGEYHREVKQKPKPKSKHEKMIEYYTYHLNLYGNTIMRKEDENKVDKVLDELNNVGYLVDTKQYRYQNGEQLILDQSLRDKQNIEVHTVLTMREAL